MKQAAIPGEGDLHILPVNLTLRPMTYDIDYAGHVSNIVYVRWLEDLRTAWLDAYAPLPDLMEDGIGPVLLHTQIDYLQPIRLFDNPVEGTLWIAEYDRLRATMRAEFHVRGKLKAQAIQIGMFFKVASGKPVRIPANILAQINEASTTK